MQLSKGFFLRFLVGAALLVPTGAVAQRSYAVGIAAGPGLPTGRFADAHSRGLSVTGFLGFGSGEVPIGWRFDGMYHTFPGRLATPPGGTVEVQNPDLRIWGVGANFVITASGSTAKPYFLAGAGAYNITPDTANAQARYYLGYSGGVGSTFTLGPLASVIEVRYHSISRKPSRGGSVHFVPILLGFVF